MTVSDHRQLAILGGTPAFDRPLHVGAPNQGDRDMFLSLVGEILDRNWLTNDGPVVQEFERQVADRCGVRHCVSMANGTIALQAAIKACRLTGEVILPSFTFVATAHALKWQGIKPVFCDVCPDRHTIDPGSVRSLITDRTSAVMGVHLWGEPCDIDELQNVARQHDLTLLFDAAHAFGSSYAGRPIGCFGRCEVLSFHATKFCQSGEGGAVVTNDDALAAELKDIRNFGFRGSDHVELVGINGKMSEVSAAMGLTSLASVDDFVEVNKSNYECYRQHLNAVPGVDVYRFDSQQARSYQYVVALVDPDICRLARDEIVCALHAENVMARRYFFPGVHRMEAYPHQCRLPNTERVADQVLVLPTGTNTTHDAIAEVCEIVKQACLAGDDVRPAIVQQNLSPTGIKIVHDYQGRK